MDGTADENAVASELDAIHSRAKVRYRAKDLGGFMAVFDRSLRYKQPDNRTIGWDQLAQDVSAQFTTIDDAETNYVRESLHVEKDEVTEVLQQTATLTSRHFFFFKRIVSLSRRGRYHWIRTADGWRIDEVEVLSENVHRGAA